MTRPDRAQCGPLPGWTPADLAEAVGGEPLVVMEGTDLNGERYALVGWGLGARAGSVAEAVRLASECGFGDGGAGQVGAAGRAGASGKPGAQGPPGAREPSGGSASSGAPALLNAVAGSLDWDGTAHFWRPAGAVLFQIDRGLLWWRGQVPEAMLEAAAARADVVDSGGPSRPAGAVNAAASASGAAPKGPGRSSQAVPRSPAPKPVRLLWDRAGYCAAVREAQRQMAGGSLTKVILSLPMEVDWQGPPLLLYRRLTSGATAGLRFYLDGGDGRGALMGISPEPLVALAGGQVRMRLLAGTRREQPGAEADLSASEKDRHEHSVAVEQARQDLLTVCQPESVAVTAFLEVERHPGLVHLASSLTGKLREDAGPEDLVRACFPASTVGGIPRDRAAAVIEALEPVPRDWYAGAVGLVLPGGGLDLWLTIRSLRYRGGVVELRTGAGLVPDSDPAAEWQECLNKAAYTLAALGGEIREQ